MTGQQLIDIFEKILPLAIIASFVEKLGIQKRQRKLDITGFLMALVFSGGTHRFGPQARIQRAYTDLGFTSVARSAFYRWFTPEVEFLMAELGRHACRWAASRPVHLPGILSGKTDWRAVDSTTVKLCDALMETYPGCGDYAALKIHREYSLGVENLVDYSVSPARDHDSKHLVIDESRRGQGLLLDLAYVSHKTFRDCKTHDVDFVVRAKGGWQLWFDESTSEEKRLKWLDEGTLDNRFKVADLDAAPAEQIVDIDVTVGPSDDLIHLRLVSFPVGRRTMHFLTTLSRETHTWAEIGLLYRLRWTIELDNKLCKSVLNVDEIKSKTPTSALILVHSAMLGAVFANAIVHEEHTRRGWTGERRRSIKQAPLHPIAVAEYVARGADRIADALINGRKLADWDRWAHLIVHFGSDPNWRSRPSAIDVVKGRTDGLLSTDAYGRNPRLEIKKMKEKQKAKKRRKKARNSS